jgi:hypothetical protein
LFFRSRCKPRPKQVGADVLVAQLDT